MSLLTTLDPGHRCFQTVSRQLADKNTRIGYVMPVMPEGKVTPQIVTLKLDPKTKGKPVVLACTYCPFCGKKL